jgi:hypothetical protein
VDRESIEQLNKEKYYWAQVLQRMISVVTFLSERGLMFRGNIEKFDNPVDYVHIMKIT